MNSIVDSILNFGNLAPKIGLLRPRRSCADSCELETVADGSLLELGDEEQEFLGLCRRDYELPDYSAGYPIPATRLFKLGPCRYFGDSGALLDLNTKCVVDESIFDEWSYRHTPISNPLSLARKSKSEATAAVIMRLPWASNNYYHWTCDVLPRIFALTHSQLAASCREPIEVLVPEDLLPYQVEGLSRLLDPAKFLLRGIGRHDTIDYRTVLLPGFVSGTGSAALPGPVLEWMRGCFLGESFEPARRRRIYVSRSKARNRRVLNENDLAKLVESLGFEVCILEGMSLKEQMVLFAEAEFIVAPHGAGLSNLFVSRRTRVLELFARNNHRAFFFFLARSIGLHYAYFDGSVMDDSENFSVDTDELGTVLSRQLTEMNGRN